MLNHEFTVNIGFDITQDFTLIRSEELPETVLFVYKKFLEKDERRAVQLGTQRPVVRNTPTK